jgi:hypothetical protein
MSCLTVGAVEGSAGAAAFGERPLPGDALPVPARQRGWGGREDPASALARDQPGEGGERGLVSGLVADRTI